LKEDKAEHEVRHLSTQKHKKELDTEKRKKKKRNIAQQELEQHRAKQRHEGKPKEESPDE